MDIRQYATTFGAGLTIASAAIFTNHREVEAPKVRVTIPTRPVVVALSDVPAGGSIDRTNVVVGRYPVGTVPVFAYASVDSVVGRIARVHIYKGEAVVPGRLLEPTDARQESAARSNPVANATRR
jgi:Flp pilus assembly protein CpaB